MSGARERSGEIIHKKQTVNVNEKQQDAQLSQRDLAAGCVSFDQKWKTGSWETIFYGHIFNHCDIIGMQGYRIR